VAPAARFRQDHEPQLPFSLQSDGDHGRFEDRYTQILELKFSQAIPVGDDPHAPVRFIANRHPQSRDLGG
jgi:hypothetical protein